ncbi:MAG: gamma-glutamyltransferase [Nitrososphaerales archaeon]
MHPTQPLLASEGIVASAHPLASLAGIRVMQEGGNAFDAAIAVNAVLNVTQPHMCGIGGDIFYLLYSSDEGCVRFLNGSGRAAKRANIEYFLQRGLKKIPSYGQLACVTVPGCVSGWEALNEKYGSKGLGELLRFAIEYAQKGIPVSRNLANTITQISKSEASSSWFKVYTPNGRAPREGDILKQEALSRSLRVVAEGGAEAFYAMLAEEISENEPEILLTEEDFTTHTSDWGEPISTEYRGYVVYETPPNTQAISTLIALNVLEGFDLSGKAHHSAETIHILVEAVRLAYEDRARYIADPRFIEIPVDYLLSKKHASDLRGRISLNQALPYAEEVWTNEGDTTYFAVVDKDRNCVSCVQSLYHPFGSRVVVGKSGVVLHNRGSYFTLDPKHHNRLEPGKRPFHTLCASITFKEEEPHIILGSMGGDGQPQTHLQILSSIIDYGLNIQEAIYKPRWVLPGTIYEKHKILLLEGRFSSSVVDGLKALEHKVSVIEPFSSMMGHAQGVVISNGGKVIQGGADPRGDGLAIGY